MSNVADNKMQKQLDILLDFSRKCLRTVRIWLIAFSAERPAAALAMVIIFCLISLPLVTSAVLMPVSVLLDISHILANKGLIYIIYTIVFQVMVLALLVLVLFLVAFLAGSGATVLHSYILSK